MGQTKTNLFVRVPGGLSGPVLWLSTNAVQLTTRRVPLEKEADKKDANRTPPVKNDGEDSEEEEHKMPNQRMQRQTTDSLTRQFKQAVDQVDSFVPARVSNAFNVMETRVKCVNESLLTCKKNTLVAWEKVLIALYFQL